MAQSVPRQPGTKDRSCSSVAASSRQFRRRRRRPSGAAWLHQNKSIRAFFHLIFDPSQSAPARPIVRGNRPSSCSLPCCLQSGSPVSDVHVPSSVHCSHWLLPLAAPTGWPSWLVQHCAHPKRSLSCSPIFQYPNTTQHSRLPPFAPSFTPSSAL